MSGIFKILPAVFCLIATMFIANLAKAQHRTCPTEEILKQQLEANPLMRLAREEIERHTQEYVTKQHVGDRSVITIPVVVNVIWREFSPDENISDEQIQSQIDVLNDDFRKMNTDLNQVPSVFAPLAADCEINFCLAKQDPNGCSTTGIRRRMKKGFTIYYENETDMKFDSKGGLDIWDRDKYLNIWVCGLEVGVLGWAQMPGGQATTDGVVIDPYYFGTIGYVDDTFNKGRTTTHEIGHWLNCFHIWGFEGCDSSDDSDLVNDTPNQDKENTGCPSFPSVSCNNGPNGDMFMNYMDYVDDGCMHMFTNGQKSRMQALFAIYGFRNSLLFSTGCLPPCGCDNQTTEISTNTLYSSDMSMSGDIIIHSGAELTIEATIVMPPGSRILVERNARLIIDNGGKITRCGPDWKGIQVLGNNQKAQPERFAPLTDPGQAGIVWIDRGTVEGARTGVSAGGGYGPEFWGGLIWTNLAIFQNNRKDVEFMSYKFTTNHSRFFETTFTENGEAFVNTEGVTIWATDDIEFHNCTFTNMDQEGIRTYDAAIKVLNNSQFDGNLIGISACATYPMSHKTSIGSGSSTENKFTSNTFDILAQNIAGYDNFTLDIVNNNFSDGQYGIAVEGGSNFRIAGNILQESHANVRVRNTGFNNVFNQNLIGCNLFQGGGNGIAAFGINKEMQFLGNDFQTCCYDFLLDQDLGQINGSIRTTQGAINSPAANCFTDFGPQQPDIIANPTETTTFRYYYQGQELKQVAM